MGTHMTPSSHDSKFTSTHIHIFHIPLIVTNAENYKFWIIKKFSQDLDLLKLQRDILHLSYVSLSLCVFVFVFVGNQDRESKMTQSKLKDKKKKRQKRENTGWRVNSEQWRSNRRKTLLGDRLSALSFFSIPKIETLYRTKEKKMWNEPIIIHI